MVLRRKVEAVEAEGVRSLFGSGFLGIMLNKPEPKRAKALLLSTSSEDRVQNMHHSTFLKGVQDAFASTNLPGWTFTHGEEGLELKKHCVAREIGSGKEGGDIATDNVPLLPQTPYPDWDDVAHYRFTPSAVASRAGSSSQHKRCSPHLPPSLPS